MNYNLSHLQQLESESIFVLREVAAQFEKPVLLFSGGKDSIVMTYLARKAFYPASIPFPLLHIDTGHNFQETLDFRDAFANQMEVKVIVRKVQDSINSGRAVEERQINGSRNVLQTITLLDAISEFSFDVALGGGRRDEEKARAKERFFSFRDEFGQWDPKNQRPEIWTLLNGKKRKGEHFRAFPLSNWTELDIWQYIAQENISIPSLYFAHARKVINRKGILLADSEFVSLQGEEKYEEMQVRFRTVGDMTCTGAVESKASTLAEIIYEIASARFTERGTRDDDKRSEAAMEDRKKEGYF
ncbi:MAG: sulfate adenylyltransferase subunit CysD [Bacteroidetes bacterium]|nr:sulfate adenylyltransferase subunit CysD [Bacteroidota bacterium]